MNEHEEILLLRERYHKMRATQDALRHRVADLHKWRTGELESRLDSLSAWCDELATGLDRLSKRLEAMATADEVANKVQEKMQATRTLRLSWTSRVAATLVACATIAASIKVLLGG